MHLHAAISQTESCTGAPHSLLQGSVHRCLRGEKIIPTFDVPRPFLSRQFSRTHLSPNRVLDWYGVHEEHFHEAFACLRAREHAASSLPSPPPATVATGVRAVAAVTKRDKSLLDAPHVCTSVRTWSADATAVWRHFNPSMHLTCVSVEKVENGLRTFLYIRKTGFTTKTGHRQKKLGSLIQKSKETAARTGPNRMGGGIPPYKR